MSQDAVQKPAAPKLLTPRIVAAIERMGGRVATVKPDGTITVKGATRSHTVSVGHAVGERGYGWCDPTEAMEADGIRRVFAADPERLSGDARRRASQNLVSGMRLLVGQYAAAPDGYDAVARGLTLIRHLDESPSTLHWLGHIAVACEGRGHDNDPIHAALSCAKDEEGKALATRIAAEAGMDVQPAEVWLSVAAAIIVAPDAVEKVVPNVLYDAEPEYGANPFAMRGIGLALLEHRCRRRQPDATLIQAGLMDAEIACIQARATPQIRAASREIMERAAVASTKVSVARLAAHLAPHLDDWRRDQEQAGTWKPETARLVEGIREIAAAANPPERQGQPKAPTAEEALIAKRALELARNVVEKGADAIPLTETADGYDVVLRSLPVGRYNGPMPSAFTGLAEQAGLRLHGKPVRPIDRTAEDGDPTVSRVRPLMWSVLATAVLGAQASGRDDLLQPGTILTGALNEEISVQGAITLTEGFQRLDERQQGMRAERRAAWTDVSVERAFKRLDKATQQSITQAAGTEGQGGIKPRDPDEIHIEFRQREMAIKEDRKRLNGIAANLILGATRWTRDLDHGLVVLSAGAEQVESVIAARSAIVRQRLARAGAAAEPEATQVTGRDGQGANEPEAPTMVK